MTVRSKPLSRPGSTGRGRIARDGRRLRVLVVTRIFPNRVEPYAGAFVRQQLAALARRCDVEVLATVPFLICASVLGDRTRVGRLRRVPPRDRVDAIPVVHPRVPYLPGTGRLRALAPLNAPLYLAGLLPHLGRLEGRFDVVLGTYLYPDAPAAVALARILGVPCVVRAHGTDVNVVSRWPSAREVSNRPIGSPIVLTSLVATVPMKNWCAIPRWTPSTSVPRTRCTSRTRKWRWRPGSRRWWRRPSR